MEANVPHAKTRKGSLIAAVALLATLGGVSGGCAYSGITSTPDGTIVLARNSLLGANRKLFVCKVVGTDLTCTESKSSP